jgi:Zn-dependent metalloprotease
MKLLLASLLILSGALPARAVRPSANAREEAKRFGLNRLSRPLLRAPDPAAMSAFSNFNAASGGRWNLRFDPRTGMPAALSEGRTAPRAGTAASVSRRFLEEQRSFLGVDPAALQISRQTQGEGQRHVLYRQTYRGLPVEFASVKVHMADDGSVIGLNSTYEPNLVMGATPAVDGAAAARAAESDSAGKAYGAPELVILPVASTGRAHLAWKVKVRAPQAAWRYYVDAMTGQVLFRYNNLRFAAGTVTGQVYDIDPSGGLIARPLKNLWVYIGNAATRALTGLTGTYSSATVGKVSMGLQGSCVNVANFRGASAHYDNGSGVWQTVATPVASAHPYANSAVVTSTIDLTALAPTAVKFLPVFSNFHVGSFSPGDAFESGDIVDDDQLTLTDGNGDPVASYVGSRGSFNGAAVAGKVMSLTLTSNESGQQYGYDVTLSSYLALTSPGTAGAGGTESRVWSVADQPAGLNGELNLFYHLNLMHDYFFGDVNRSSAAAVSRPVLAMAHVGPTMVNAFYDPEMDNLMFGDVDAAAPKDYFTEDATVPHHEYVHYLLEKIWPIQNFGQAGAISEGNADYFSASSLNESAIGLHVNQSLGNPGPLRELDCQKVGQTCQVLSEAAWTGSVHLDSIFFSQALWDIRRNRIAALGASAGRSCADGLVFQSLLFFPESFREFYDAIRRVESEGRVAACGGASVPAQAAIVTAFTTTHGLIPAVGDVWESNDGFETAVDMSTRGAVSATISPVGDTDFWTFGAGPGLVKLTLNLPPSGGYYKAYQLKLFDRSRRLVAAAAPAYNGLNTVDGVCSAGDCNTTASQIQLLYNNPSGGQLYAQVIGGDALRGSASGVNSTTPYSLIIEFPQSGALSAGIVSASFDRDTIAFTVNVTTFASSQDWRFSSAQLRDQSFAAIANTRVNVPASAGDYLTLVSSANGLGLITGSVRLAPGFGARFPSAGTVHLEIFGYNVSGSTVSLGLSNPINLTASAAELTAYNNVFNPAQGGKATIKYGVTGAGRVVIKLFTVTGTYVSTLLDADMPAGKGSLDWNGRNLSGAVVASGVYIVHIDGPGINKTQKVAIVK